MSIAIIIALAAAVLGPLGTYLIAARKLSGKISTSAATDLWAESKAIRVELEGRNRYLRDRLDVCEAKFQTLVDKVSTLEEEVLALKREKARLGYD